MVRSSSSVVVLVLSALAALAVPVERRESVLLTCNTARLGVISGLNSTSRSIEALLSSSNDSVVTSACNEALSGLHTAQEGVSIIVKGVLAGVTPDDTGVPAIAGGLSTANQALTSINSSDTNVQSQLATILMQLNTTKSNGDTAITECAKLSSTSSNSTSSNSSSTDSTLSNSNSSRKVLTETVTVTATATKTVNGAASIQTEADGTLLFGFGRRASNDNSSSSSQCDSAKTVAVSAFEQAAKDIQQLAKTAGRNNSTQSAAQSAISALTSAGGAVSQVVTDVAVPAFNAIGEGILDAQNALNTINSTDSSTNTALDIAQLDMVGILSAAQHLAIDCTPTAGGVASSNTRRGLGAWMWGF
ncbi:hypothetical protein DFJ43DRAFT_1161656 [Lentinula guzmanii]|uniref:Uncharacterized protein n=1 Tax=Lentinula guzmanii TaxID=2804957 RepID=A0AA38MUG3_9AGAR|nr:hypothetical protein DFJ43DRAFT_1161656 [Lentinula guzmanii]